MSEETQNELIPLKKLQNPLQIFTESEMDKILDEIKKKTDELKPDLTTDKSRKEISSMAYKVSRSKKALEKLSSELTEDWKIKTKAVVDVRIKMSARLDALRDEVRKPLTDYENAEKEKIAAFQKTIDNIEEEGSKALATWQDLREGRLEEIKKILTEWQCNPEHIEWQDYFKEIKYISLEKVNLAIQKREIYDKEQAELKVLREDTAKRQAEEEQKRVEEAENKAQIERERYAAEQKLHIERARTEAAEEAKRKAEESAAQVAVEKAEIQHQKDVEIEQERQAAVKAQEKAKRDAEKAKIAADEAARQAAARERQKIKDEENQRLADEKRREDNKEHQRKINNQAVDGLVKAGLNKEKAHAAIKAIILGEVPNVKINY